jgi:hypothetical protein
MTVCEFCDHYQKGECRLGLNLPKKMACVEFLPGIDRFCSDPKDFVNTSQITEMAQFFGFQKTELKKIRMMATREESARTERQLANADALKQTLLTPG